MKNKRGIFVVLSLLLALTILLSSSVLGAELLFYKPYSGALRYNLTIKTHALLDTGNARRYGSVFRDHEDIMTLSQRVQETEEGLLDIATTVDKINFLPHGPTYGADYNREQIEGNTQHIKINLLGKVETATKTPSFGAK